MGAVTAAGLLAALASCAGTPGAGTGTGEPSTGVDTGHPSAVAPDVGSGAPEALAALASCPEAVWPADGSGQALHLGTHQGASVFQISDSTSAPDTGPATVVAVGKIGPEEPPGCLVLQPMGGAAPVTGALWPLGGRVQAVLLGSDACNPEHCPSALLIRDGERPLGALFLPEACDRALTLARLRWFAGQDSVQLTCHQSAGAGHHESISIVHVGPTGPVPVFTLATGTAEAATLEERETPGFCELRPVGWVRLVEPGERPVIEAFDPGRGQPGEDGKGTGLVVDFRYDPGTGQFEQIGPGTLEPYDARGWCKQ